MYLLVKSCIFYISWLIWISDSAMLILHTVAQMAKAWYRWMWSIKDLQEGCYGLTALRRVSLQEAGVGELSTCKGSHAQLNQFCFLLCGNNKNSWLSAWPGSTESGQFINWCGEDELDCALHVISKYTIKKWVVVHLAWHLITWISEMNLKD